MRLVEGRHWVEDPNTSYFLGSTTTTPNSLTSFGVSLLSDIAAGVSFCFCLETPFSLSADSTPFFINLSSPFAVVERLPEHHSND
jgi:hypothetical protein